MKRSVILAWFLGLFGWPLLLRGTIEARASDPRLDKVLADWQKRQNRFQTIEYQVEGEHTIPKGAYSGIASILNHGRPDGRVVPPEDLTGTASFSILLDFARERHRLQTREVTFAADSGKLGAQVKTYTFDGKVWKCFVPREDNPALGKGAPEMAILSGSMNYGAFLGNYFPVFFGHGRIYTAMEPILPGQMKNKPDSDYLYVHGTGVQDGRPCIILRTQTLQMSTTSYDEYWVDGARDGAIVRYLLYSGDQPRTDIAIQYHESHETWLPESWRISVLSRPGEALYYQRMQVTKRRLNLPVSDADFEMDAKPGMIVEEVKSQAPKNPLAPPTKTELSVYRVKENGGKEYIPDPYNRKEWDRFSDHVRTWHWFWLAVPLAAILALVGWVWWRRNKAV